MFVVFINLIIILRAIIKVVKTSLIAIKAAFTLLIAGGWIEVIVVLIVCIMGGAMALYKAIRSLY